MRARCTGMPPAHHGTCPRTCVKGARLVIFASEGFGVCIQPDAGSDAIADALTDPIADALADACADAEVRGSISGDASSWYKVRLRLRAICDCIQPDAGSDPIADAVTDACADAEVRGSISGDASSNARRVCV